MGEITFTGRAGLFLLPDVFVSFNFPLQNCRGRTVSSSPGSQPGSSGGFLPEIIERDQLSGVFLRQKFSPDLVKILPVDPQTFDKPSGLVFAPLFLKTHWYRVLNLRKKGNYIDVLLSIFLILTSFWRAAPVS